MDRRFPSTNGIFVLFLLLPERIDGWMPSQAVTQSFPTSSSTRLFSESSWSITDDWNGLSKAESADNNLPFGLIHQVDSPEKIPSAEEQWLQDTVDAILYDKEDNNDSSETIHQKNNLPASFEDDMGDEIALLIRCNEQPQSMLVQEGRALPPLTNAERFHPSQLLERFVGEQWVSSKFLDRSVNKMFDSHAKTATTRNNDEKIKVMDAKSVASWFQRCLQPAQAIGPHDQRVLSILAAYSSYGTGYLTLDDLKRLYLLALVGEKQSECNSPEDIVKRRSDALKSVWRDLKHHGILPPLDVERERMQLEMVLTHEPTTHFSSHNSMDECDLVYEKLGDDRVKKSSHKLVELASDKETPLWINDGEFIFIDEDSCIGCTNCALAAPGSFEILSDDGRARTFDQRPRSPDIAAAIAACPVDCMHDVSFDELKELETARDEGDGREDHRHFGSSKARGTVARKPLHVQRRESDASHRSSWYHYLKDKCCKSSACPERGCFDCPSYKNGSNPFFQERVRKATHIRSKHFIDMGVAKSYRKTADL
ncbi:hypothetical protein MPSEU_000217600 [Mayamaea pseudoterrestris]|nr:hypothetical protein MPSEU_000217600 [Mayamaea pseudoterrestris]